MNSSLHAHRKLGVVEDLPDVNAGPLNTIVRSALHAQSLLKALRHIELVLGPSNHLRKGECDILQRSWNVCGVRQQ